MARAKFQTLTEQMFYILLCLRQEDVLYPSLPQAGMLRNGYYGEGP